MQRQDLGLDAIDADIVASTEVRLSGVRINTVPAGSYGVSIVSVQVNQQDEDADWNPGRMSLNIRLKTEEGRTLFMDASWQPNGKGEVDNSNKRYSELEQVLGMVGQPVRDVASALEDKELFVEVIETARVEVGLLPAEHQVYYVETKGLGETTPVTFYIREEDEETRNHLYSVGAKVRNYIKYIKA